MAHEIENKIDLTETMMAYDDMVVDENSLWYIMAGQNILMEVNRVTGTVNVCGPIPGCGGPGKEYRFLLKYHEKIILLPYDFDVICVYDIQKSKFLKNTIKIDLPENYKNCKISGGKIINDDLILYGLHPILIKMNLKKETVKVINLLEMLPSDLKEKYWFWKYSYIYENKLLLFPVSYPCVLLFDNIEEGVECRYIAEKNEGFIMENPVLHDDWLWYTDSKEENKICLLKHNLVTKERKEYVFPIKHKARENYFYPAFGFMLYQDEQLWMLPCSAQKGYKFDVKGEELKEISDLPSVDEDKLKTTFPLEYCYRNAVGTDEGKIFALHIWDQNIVEINAKSKSVHIIPLKGVECEEVAKIYKNTDGGIYPELSSQTLKTIFETSKNSKDLEQKADSIGAIIYRAIS